MASLKQREGVYYIVFTRRLDGRLQQRAFSLETARRAMAERMRGEYEDRYARREIDPFEGWSPRADALAKRPAPPPSHLLEEVAHRFMESRSHVRERTRRGYRWLLDKLIGEIGRTMPLRRIMEQDVRDFCFRPSYSTATQTSYLRFCKMLFHWAHETGIVERDVARRVKYPRPNYNTSDKIITEEQFHAVIHAHRKARRRSGSTARLWFRPLVMTLYFAGLRAREVVELRWEKVDLRRGFLHITNTKSGRERAVPIRRGLEPVLRAWHRLNGKPKQGLVFSKGGVGGEKRPLSTDYVSKTYKRFARLAELPERANLHGLRHTCATELLRGGMQINEVADFMGHERLDTVKIYDHQTEHDLKAKLSRLGL